LLDHAGEAIHAPAELDQRRNLLAGPCGLSSFAILSVVSRTSTPVAVVSKTRSIVSLAVVWLTYCFFFEPDP
jgi:hypothetical protein